MKVLKFIGWSLGVLLLVISLYFIKAYVSTESRMHQKYSFVLSPFTLQSDSAILSEGERLVKTKDCGACHGKNMAGKVWLDDPLLARIVAPNLTKGSGGLPANYNTSDWLRSLQHGLTRDSTVLLIMPSHEYSQLSKEDLNAIIAYCSSLKPIDHSVGKSSIGFLGYILSDLGKIPLLPAENIDHERELIKDVSRTVSFEFGQYLSTGCEGCHRKNMKGGSPLAPGFPEVADITSTGNVGRWSEQQFITTLKTGLTPEGKVLNPAEMPYTAFKSYTDTELKALYKYLSTI